VCELVEFFFCFLFASPISNQKKSKLKYLTETNTQKQRIMRAICFFHPMVIMESLLIDGVVADAIFPRAI
jgi:hypothetical protein